MPKQTFIISLGGSVIVPSGIDTEFCKGFKNLITRQAAQGKRFIITCGGGRTAREYQTAAKAIMETTKEDLDWLGIHSTRLNAQLLRDILRPISRAKIIKNPHTKTPFRESVMIAAGWKPGRSTDHTATVLAKNYGLKTIINITNKDYVYSSNPDEDRNAKPIQRLTWKQFRDMFGTEWSPGLNTPFDPVASRIAQKAGMAVIVMGKDLKNLENFIEGKPFRGTAITD
ncbi:UMP kinase [Candidatus Woesearchaeota archaeon]|nr:UMP kinase [Candidatus Woesearchaeota archaeon]